MKNITQLYLRNTYDHLENHFDTQSSDPTNETTRILNYQN